MKKLEHKTLAERLEVKFAADDTATKTFNGYGAYFGNQDAYGDVIQAGAFAKSIADFKSRNAMPACLWNHDAMAMPIGIWTDIEEDSRGLKVSGQFLDTTAGNDAYTITKAGAVTGLSIGYFVTGFEIVKSGQNVSRLITEIKLFEISVVTFPANQMAQIADVKSIELDSLKVSIANLAEELKSLGAKIEAKDFGDDCEGGDDCDDGECECDPDDDDCDCETNAELKSEDDEEDGSDDAEAKYIHEAAMAVKTLCLKLKQESHG